MYSLLDSMDVLLINLMHIVLANIYCASMQFYYADLRLFQPWLDIVPVLRLRLNATI